MWNRHLGRFNSSKHQIESFWANAKPIYSALYRVSQKARDVEKNKIKSFLAEGVIEPAQTEWTAPVVVTAKMDGFLCICVEYQNLNSVTKQDFYQISHIKEFLDSLGDVAVFSTLNKSSGYRLVKTEKKDGDKTEFTLNHELYCFMRISFG